VNSGVIGDLTILSFLTFSRRATDVGELRATRAHNLLDCKVLDDELTMNWGLRLRGWLLLKKKRRT